MIDSKYRISLDIHSTASNVRLKCKRGDTGRTIYAALTERGFPYHISDDCYAVFTATKPDGNKVFNKCRIEDCVIVYEFTPQTVAVTGLLKCEIKLYGADDQLITSPSFLLEVHDAQVNDGDELESEKEVEALTHLISQAIGMNAKLEKVPNFDGGAKAGYFLMVSEVDEKQQMVTVTSVEAPRVGGTNIYVGPDEPTDPNVQIWINPEETVPDVNYVKSVNGQTPDENGNVEIKIPESSGSSVTIDPTLTQSGQAADAKAVGDAIANLDIPSIEGLATEEYVDEAIANIDLPSGGNVFDLELISSINLNEDNISLIEIDKDSNGNGFVLKDVGIKLILPSFINNSALFIESTTNTGINIRLAYLSSINRQTQYFRKFYSDSFGVSIFGSASDASSEIRWDGFVNTYNANVAKIQLKLGATDAYFPVGTKVELWGVRA